MTPDRLRYCLDTIGWTQHQLAGILGLHETRTRRWAAGKYAIPPNVAEWLERLADAHATFPLPVGWEARGE